MKTAKNIARSAGNQIAAQSVSTEQEQEAEQYAIKALQTGSGETLKTAKQVVSKIKNATVQDQELVREPTAPSLKEPPSDIKGKDRNVKKRESVLNEPPLSSTAPARVRTHAADTILDNTEQHPQLKVMGINSGNLKDHTYISPRKEYQEQDPRTEPSPTPTAHERGRLKAIDDYKREHLNDMQKIDNGRKLSGVELQEKQITPDISISEKPAGKLKTHERQTETVKTRPYSSVKHSSVGFKPDTARTIKTAESTAKSSAQAAQSVSQTANMTAQATVKGASSAAGAASGGVGIAIQAATEIGKKIKQGIETISRTQTTEGENQGHGFLGVVVAALSVPIFILLTILFGGDISSSGTNKNLSDEALAYYPLVSEYCVKYEIPEYTAIVMAILMQESGGRTEYAKGDVMQSAESQGLPVGTPLDPAVSIDYGVKHFKQCLVLADMPSPADIDRLSLAIQGYNYGTGYITWAKSKYGSYTLDNAIEFSDIWAVRMGWSSYGDKQYVPHVLRYYEASTFGDVGEIGIVGDGIFAYPMPDYKWDTYFEHEGIDLVGGGIFGKPIYASASGTVGRVYNGWTSFDGIEDEMSYGNCVYINHENGYQTRYAHMINAVVSPGQYVQQGQVIGYVGSSGNSSGPHLHFSIYYNGSPWAIRKTLCYAEKAFPQYKR